MNTVLSVANGNSASVGWRLEGNKPRDGFLPPLVHKLS